MNALVYVKHRPEHSLRKKSDEHLQCSPQSWLDDFTQPFSWRSSLSRALDFLNKLFLPGVNTIPVLTRHVSCFLNLKFSPKVTFEILQFLFLLRPTNYHQKTKIEFSFQFEAAYCIWIQFDSSKNRREFNSRKKCQTKIIFV